MYMLRLGLTLVLLVMFLRQVGGIGVKAILYSSMHSKKTILNIFGNSS